MYAEITDKQISVNSAAAAFRPVNLRQLVLKFHLFHIYAFLNLLISRSISFMIPEASVFQSVVRYRNK